MIDAAKTTGTSYGLIATAMLVIVSFARASAADEALAPWAANHHPSDAPKMHVEEIDAGRSDYVVKQGGTMDGRNCRSPNSAYSPFQQTWESNRSVRIENIGQTDVINPWLSNGRNNLRTMDEIVAGAVRPGMSDAEKAYALWWQEIQYRYHWPNADNVEVCDPVKVFNVYGFNTCGNDSICLAGLWRKAGLTKIAPCRAVGHCISQTFFDGGWHLLDGDMNAVYLLRDNRTIAGEQDVVRDRDLVRRTHTEGILSPDGNRGGDEHEAALYVFEGPVTGDRRCTEGTTMNMTLRPGEALTWRWGHLEPLRQHGNSSTNFPNTICNGLWEYCPNFSDEIWRKGAMSVDGIRADAQGLGAEAGKTGSIVWRVQCPYVFVGGKLEVEGKGAVFAISWDGKTWQEVKGGDFDKCFTAATPARYEYRIRCQLTGDARLKRLGIVNDVQMAPLTLPEMAVGENKFTYQDETRGERKLRITHEWVERSASTPPDAPVAAIFPPDGGMVDGTDLVFRWKAAVDADGDKIADYHFELSSYEDMRWPLSMSFAKFSSKTADGGKAQYALPAAGLLNPDTTYFWHVRAKDDKGVWGAWSKTWSFKARAAAPPQEVALDFDANRGIGTLRWKPSAIGVRPVKYRIYGSDERGFSISDQPYKAGIGISKVLPSPFPANFIAETDATEFAVLGAEVDLPAANKTYYRVVAVDETGRRSGPSDYAAAPRPLIYSKPVTLAKAGEAYRYEVRTTRSVGDLTARQVEAGGKEVMNYWSLEKPVFAIGQGPKWLAIDPATGILSGTPDSSGRFDVAITATIDREARKVDEAALKWGNEKVISNGSERVGVATQKFTIEVASQVK
jgi:hypothetical protein